MKKNAKDFKIIIKPSRGRDCIYVDHISGERKYKGAGVHGAVKHKRNTKYPQDYLEECYEELEEQE